MSTSMRILLPYISQTGEKLGQSKNLTGGIEKHIHSIYDEFECIPFEVTVKEKSSFAFVQKKLKEAINKYKPDLIYNNYHQKSFMDFNTPILWHWHCVNGGSMQHLTLVHSFNKLKDDLTIVGVSNFQQHTYDSLSDRQGIGRVKFERILKPDYSLEQEVVEPTYDTSTIGRLEKQKDPLFASKIFKDCRIFTTTYEDEIKRAEHNPNSQKAITNYYYKYKDNVKNHFQGISYDETMKQLGEAKVFISTCEYESFGITALEALTRGVPCILCAATEAKSRPFWGTHASSELSPSSDYVKVILKDAPIEDYLNAFDELSKLDRKQIAKDTIEKHKKEDWKKSYEEVFSYTVEKFNKDKFVLG
jgi:hypothetical protein